MLLLRRRRHPPRRHVLQYQRDHTIDECGRPAPGAVAYGDGLAFCFGEQCCRLALGRTQHLLGGALPHLVGFRMRLGHDLLGLPFCFPPV